MLEPLPTLRPPQYDGSPHARNLPASAALGWLMAGWRDFLASPAPSLAYGALVVVLSYAVLWLLWVTGLSHLVLPAISGFLIVAPLFALGLYEKSWRIERGEGTSFLQMLAVRPAAGGQIIFAGLMLSLLVLLWIRAADLLYALVFGMTAFHGFEEAMVEVFTTPRGWILLASGTVVGGLFAAFSFAISMFSIPMLMSEDRDALTAMGLSFAMTNRNLAPCIAWGAIVALGLALAAGTRLFGLAIIFPILGHGTWHAWRAIGGIRR